MTIGELAKRFGLRPSALRFYGRNRLLDAPARIGGKHAYDAGALRRVAFIREAQATWAQAEQNCCSFLKIDCQVVEADKLAAVRVVCAADEQKEVLATFGLEPQN